jgi:hypothetical protein
MPCLQPDALACNLGIFLQMPAAPPSHRQHRCSLVMQFEPTHGSAIMKEKEALTLQRAPNCRRRPACGYSSRAGSTLPKMRDRGRLSSKTEGHI